MKKVVAFLNPVNRDGNFEWPIWLKATYWGYASVVIILMTMQIFKLEIDCCTIMRSEIFVSGRALEVTEYALMCVAVCQMLWMILAMYLLYMIPRWLVRYQRRTVRRLKWAVKHRLTLFQAWKLYFMFNLPAIVLYSLFCLENRESERREASC